MFCLTKEIMAAYMIILSDLSSQKCFVLPKRLWQLTCLSSLIYLHKKCFEVGYTKRKWLAEGKPTSNWADLFFFLIESLRSSRNPVKFYLKGISRQERSRSGLPLPSFAQQPRTSVVVQFGLASEMWWDPVSWAIRPAFH